MKNQLLTICLFLCTPFFANAQAGCTNPQAHNFDPAAVTNDGSCETCFDLIQNGDEQGVDCGGVNPNCPNCPTVFHLEVEGNAKIHGSLELIQSLGDSSLFIGLNAGLVDDGGVLNGNAGNSNTFIGTNAGKANTFGENNTFLGMNAGLSNTPTGGIGGASDGSSNTFLGTFTGISNTVGAANTLVGTSAGFNNINGFSNTFVGTSAGLNNTTGNSNTLLGTSANVGSGNLTNATAIGTNTIVNQSNSVILGNNANVGIGTSTPGVFKLKVVQDFFGINLENNGNDWEFYSSSAVDGPFQLYANGSLRGNFNGTTGAYTSTSDRRLKQHIKILEPILEKVLQLKPSRYQFIKNNPSNTETIGFIAQDVEKLFPEFVFESEDKRSKGIHTMDYSGFGILAIKAIQEQQALIEQLQSQNQLLKTRLDALEQQNQNK